MKIDKNSEGQRGSRAARFRGVGRLLSGCILLAIAGGCRSGEQAKEAEHPNTPAGQEIAVAAPEEPSREIIGGNGVEVSMSLHNGEAVRGIDPGGGGPGTEQRKRQPQHPWFGALPLSEEAVAGGLVLPMDGKLPTEAPELSSLVRKGLTEDQLMVPQLEIPVLPAGARNPQEPSAGGIDVRGLFSMPPQAPVAPAPAAPGSGD
jgi:hypothetical protein